MYINSEINNNNLYSSFTELTDTINYLREHRDYIEKNDLGFGERAFHYMWLIVIEKLTKDFDEIKVLEIGVYKGQIISLWALIAKKLDLKIEITGITPLEGNQKIQNKLIKKILNKVSKKFRENNESGNFYQRIDYLETINSLFNKFDLNSNLINLIKGYSDDFKIIQETKDKKFHLIYIDGDHTLKGVTNDIINYSKLIVKNGLLVMDDSACNIPGSIYWKGHQSVSDACEIIEDLGFVNILNIGHNRIFKKL